ncbi:hypothetical protein Q9L42_020365 (plasmid) [Methylomarinum sp. Ch1-1]|uniref:Transglutaminase-like domain-containing protein n=1 Tax=Methylomarinum roseum TaxID=3067653 RepID=A0AAU7P0E1_9GAMM|nr:hypothetical protein [Methylomarinum sp. Ch1-1]MDP4523266.1 hypothetical protein [Methylomarinum sp. Ch1-1]
MGEAKNKAKRFVASIQKLNDLDLSDVVSAMQKLAIASSAQFCGDCYVHAGLCQALLKELGVETELCVGFAAWRVGEGNSDVIVHGLIRENSPQAIDYMKLNDPRAIPYHAWLECGYWLIDFTTYQLEEKAARLDAMDGGHTDVDWQPDYLIIEKKSISQLKDVIQTTTGTYWYERVMPLEKRIKALAGSIDQEDLENLKLIYEHKDIHVVGPCGAI